jgi:hypothetical protein
MAKSKKPVGRALESAVPEEIVDLRIENWVRAILESNNNLAVVLKRLRESYCAVLAGKPVRDDDEILAQVEAVLQRAEKAKHVS